MAHSQGTQWEHDLAASYLRETFKCTTDNEVDHGNAAFSAIREAVFDIAAEHCVDTLLQIMNVSHTCMTRSARPDLEGAQVKTWRKVYTDAAILRGLSLSLRSRGMDAVATLDHAIIVAGPYGIGTLDFILTIIGKIQRGMPTKLFQDGHHKIRTVLTLANFLNCTIPCLTQPPSFLRFQAEASRRPFILQSFASNWPAVERWRSLSYLYSIAGPGRVVPVEIGTDYRRDDWKQKIMGWEELISGLDLGDGPTAQTQMCYLAQHDLTKQFPALRNDIHVPDYVYADLESPEFPAYKPPVATLYNTWLGPTGTISPAHTDPYFNIYVQVCGYKSVWLAPPHISNSMYPLTSGNQTSTSNTSRVDVFSEHQDQDFPQFREDVVPLAMSATLNPGDVLFFPPGWWHAMRSETTSFSFSIWF